MNSARILATAVVATLASGCLYPAVPSDGSLTIDNASSHVLIEVRVAPVDSVTWGPNLLPGVLYPEERLTIFVACDLYDILVVDEHSRQCVLGGVDLCFYDDYWVIDNPTLRYCGF